MQDRMPKTPEQIAAIEEVQRAVEAAATAVIEYLRTSAAPTAEEAHAIIDRVLGQAGCESPHGHIVAGGRESAKPHAVGTGPFKKSEPIVIDIYPRSKTSGYFADMTRTVCIGQPSPELQKMYDAVFGAQELAISMVRPGAKARDIQQAVEQFFTQAGFVSSGESDKKEGFAFAEGFVHGVGHGVGHEIHENPRIGRVSDDVLAEGDVVTIEPGLYYKALGGVRIEDMVLVTKDGCRIVTKFTKSFVI